jgi:uncharacterized protein YodC (DUF2158 family)
MTDSTQFPIGTVVQLKSGGPLMTVIEVDGDVRVAWFSGTTIDTQNLPVQALNNVRL